MILILGILLTISPLFSSTFTHDWTSPYQKSWYKHLKPFIGKKNISYLEIGIFEGKTSLWMLDNILTDPSSKAVGIDIEFPPHLIPNTITPRKTGKLKLIKENSTTALIKIPAASFDIIYVDGSHLAKQVSYDLLQAWRILKHGGILLLDDYQLLDGNETRRKAPINLRPQLAIDGFIHSYQDEIEILQKSYQIILQKIPPPCPGLYSQCSVFFNYFYSWNLYDLPTSSNCQKKGLFKIKNKKAQYISLSPSEITLIETILIERPNGWSKNWIPSRLKNNATWFKLKKKLLK